MLNLYSIKQFCIELRSGTHPKLCSRDPKGAYGSSIDVLQNGSKIGTVPAGFRRHSTCLPYYSIDLRYDQFQLKSTGDDDVSIFEL